MRERERERNRERVREREGQRETERERERGREREREREREGERERVVQCTPCYYPPSGFLLPSNILSLIGMGDSLWQSSKVASTPS